MATTSAARKKEIRARYKTCPVDAPMHCDVEIETLSDFFAVFNSLLDPGKTFWFRGHSQLSYRLCPSALRHGRCKERDLAIGLVGEMKRFLEFKLPKPPSPTDLLGWIQVAQHYGLSTRLLDWTQNAAVALFFACCSNEKSDGLVAILNPIELNQAVDPRVPRVFTPHNDAHIIAPYLTLDGRARKPGRPTIAINPTWNNERIALQQGAFTLHGSRCFELDRLQARSLSYVPILWERKHSLLSELERVGVGEMFIFPEPEHVCKHLRRANKL